MNAPTAPPLARSIRLALLGAPALWLTLFWIVYLGAEWACRPGTGTTGRGERVDTALLAGIVVVGGLAAIAALAIGLRALRRHPANPDDRHRRDGRPDPDGPGRDEVVGHEVDLGMLGVASILVGGCSLLAIGAMLVPLLVFGRC